MASCPRLKNSHNWERGTPGVRRSVAHGVRRADAQVEKLLAENAALRARLDQQARDAKRQAAPFSKGRARPTPSPRDVSQARGASRSAPCRLPAGGPHPRSRSGCPSRSVPVVANRWRNIASSSPPSPTSPRSPSRSCSPIGFGCIAAPLVTRPCGLPTRISLPTSSVPPPTGSGHGSWPRRTSPITAWASRSARSPPSCRLYTGVRRPNRP